MNPMSPGVRVPTAQVDVKTRGVKRAKIKSKLKQFTAKQGLSSRKGAMKAKLALAGARMKPRNKVSTKW